MEHSKNFIPTVAAEAALKKDGVFSTCMVHILILVSFYLVKYYEMLSLVNLPLIKCAAA